MEKIRTFIAIEIPDSVRSKIEQVQDVFKKNRERISWTKPENIHLTLKFLGDIDTDKVDPISKVLEKVAAEFKVFEFQISGLGAFPNIRRPRVLWVGIDNPTNELLSINKEIEAGLSEFGFKRENKRFNAHLTIGRVKSPVSPDFINKFESFDMDNDTVKVEEIILIRSILHPQGAIYKHLQKVNLKNSLN